MTSLSLSCAGLTHLSCGSPPPLPEPIAYLQDRTPPPPPHTHSDAGQDCQPGQGQLIWTCRLHILTTVELLYFQKYQTPLHKTTNRRASFKRVLGSDFDQI